LGDSNKQALNKSRLLLYLPTDSCYCLRRISTIPVDANILSFLLSTYSMDEKNLTLLLSQIQTGDCSIPEALAQLQHFPAETLKDACLDHQRSLRTGIPEVIYGASKTAEQIINIARALLSQSGPVMATRVDREKAASVRGSLPELQYSSDARMLFAKECPADLTERRGTVMVVCAGTSDIQVAEEAFLTAACFGNPVTRLYDVGVAGLHRLLAKRNLLSTAKVIIVVAGMEGALPSVVGGLVSCPVIAVPTSVGYGASFGGIAALLGMLNSCAPGVAVVNIDNGFGAGCMADAINRR
jgi:pyridinium-3,5-biscarboxylic acid mononucleotide synthase